MSPINTLIYDPRDIHQNIIADNVLIFTYKLEALCHVTIKNRVVTVLFDVKVYLIYV